MVAFFPIILFWFNESDWFLQIHQSGSCPDTGSLLSQCHIVCHMWVLFFQELNPFSIFLARFLRFSFFSLIWKHGLDDVRCRKKGCMTGCLQKQPLGGTDVQALNWDTGFQLELWENNNLMTYGSHWLEEVLSYEFTLLVALYCCGYSWENSHAHSSHTVLQTRTLFDNGGLQEQRDSFNLVQLLWGNHNVDSSPVLLF